MENYKRLVSYLPKGWGPDDFVLCGSACLAARGVRDVGDLDVLIRPELWEVVTHLHFNNAFPAGKKVLPFYEDPVYESAQLEGRRLLMTGEIDFFDTMPRITNLGNLDIFGAATIIGGYRVVSLRHCMAIKALVPQSRPKDVTDMLLLAELIAEEEG